MSVLNGLRVAMEGLLADPVGSALAALSVLIGVSALVLLVGGSVAPAPSSVVSVYPTESAGAGPSPGGGHGLSNADALALRDPVQAPDVAAAVPITAVPGTLLYKRQNWRAQTSGSTQDFPQVGGYQMAAGSFFSATDVQNSDKVIVLGQGVVDGLFGGDPDAAVGQTVGIQRQPFRVVGTFAPTGSTGAPQDNVALVPVTAAWNDLLGGRGEYVDQILLEARDPGAVGAVEGEATEILLNQHKISDPSRADFQVQSPQDVLRTGGQITGLPRIALGAGAAILLIGGGVGIERLVLSGPRALLRSLMLALSGGLLGVGAGAGFVWLGNHVAGRTVLPASVLSTPSVVLALGVSLGIGMFFGIYPANRGDALEPADALRYK